MRGLITLKELKTEKILELIKYAEKLKKGFRISYPDKKIATLFFENSTRTHYSFQVALMNLGISIIDLNADDFKYLFHRDKVTFNGYYMRVDEKPADDNIPKGRPIIDYQFGDTAYQYLDKLTKLCKDNDIELILVKAPSLFPYWYPQWDKQIEDYAAANDLTYINFLDYQDSIGLDWDKDTYDGGLHLNLSGAEKLSEYFGQILSNDFNVPDRRGEEDLEKYWDGVIERYDAEIQRQTTNLEKYGSVHGPDGE